MHKTEEELKNEFNKKAHNILADAQKYFEQGCYDDAVIKSLQHVMIYADEGTEVWQQAKLLFEKVKRRRLEENEVKNKAEMETKNQEKERRAQNAKKLHIGLIDAYGFYYRGELRDYTFITLIDGYNKLIVWHMGEDDYDDDDDEYENENWDDSDDKEYKIIKEVFFHISDKGEGGIKSALDSIRRDSDDDIDDEEICDKNVDDEYADENANRNIAVVFEMVPSKKGKKAVNVITIEDALADAGTRQYIKEMAQNDVNVYFFLMEHVPNLFTELFAKNICEKIWDYRENDDSIELIGAHLKNKRCWNDQKLEDSDAFYFPSSIVFLPDCIAGKPVTKISDSAFAHTKNVERFIIPETVVCIGKEAFEGCNNLRRINLPSKITKIASRTFASCSCLKIIKFSEELTVIGEEAFTEGGLQYLSIPSSVKSIGNRAFSNSELISVELPQNLKTVGVEIFSDCKNLKRVVFPEQCTLKRIEKGMFKECKELIFIHLCLGIEVVCKMAFYNCRYLPSDLLPDGVKSIEEYAFGHGFGEYGYDRWDDRSISIPNSVNEIQENAWSQDTIPIVVPGSFAERYCVQKRLRYSN